MAPSAAEASWPASHIQGGCNGKDRMTHDARKHRSITHATREWEGLGEGSGVRVRVYVRVCSRGRV
eukprot:14322-Eustigmatos_ZCMA.PRE.1